MKNIIIALLILLAVGFTFYFINKQEAEIDNDTNQESELIDSDTSLDDGGADFTGLSDEERAERIAEAKKAGKTEVEWSRKTTLGKSVEGKNIVAYQYGTGDTELLFVGGIHGGYSWNTSAVAYDLMEYIEDNEGVISDDIQVTIIPALNPDGLSDVAPDYESGVETSDITASQDEKVAARFNANDVDLNRNFDCEWQTNAKWQNRDVSGGDSAFSEPESRAVRDYVTKNKPDAVVVWYSAGGGVFSSNCRGGVLPETSKITDLYAKATGYKAYDSFDFYATTGDMVNWLAKEGIPAVSVLLTTHNSPETSKNIEGFKALLNYYK